MHTAVPGYRYISACTRRAVDLHSCRIATFSPRLCGSIAASPSATHFFPRTLHSSSRRLSESAPRIGSTQRNVDDWRSKLAKSDAERKAKALQERQNLRDELKNLSGNNHKELYRTSGKPYTTPLDLCHIGNARVVPEKGAFTCTMLDEKSLSIPDEFSEHAATLVVVGFNQQAFDFGAKWIEAFMKDYPQDGEQEKAKCLQFSIISNSMIGALFGSYMASKFKESVPVARHAVTAMVTENVFDHRRLPSTYIPLPPQSAEQDKADAASLAQYQSALKAATADPSLPAPPLLPDRRRTTMLAEPGWSIQNPLLCHVFLVDGSKRVRWRAVGPPAGDDLDILQRVTQKLIRE